MKVWAIVAIGVGLVILFVGNSLASIGDSVDRLIRSKLTGVALLGFGLVVLGIESKAFSKL